LLYNVSYYMLATVDRWVIIKYLDYKSLGYYTFANQMVSATLVFLSSILFLNYPSAIKRLNKENIKDKREAIEYVSKSGKKLELLSVLLIFGGLLFIEPFIKIMMKEYIQAITVFRILSVGAVLFRLSAYENIYVVSNKKQAKLTMLLLISVIFVAILNLIFVKFNGGLEGVALATMLANVFYCLGQSSIFFKLINEPHKVKHIAYQYHKILIFSAVIIIISFLKVNYLILLLITFLLGFFLYAEDIKVIIKKI